MTDRLDWRLPAPLLRPKVGVVGLSSPLEVGAEQAPALVNGVAAALHKNIITPFINHLFQQCINGNCIRCGMCGNNYFFADPVLHGTDQTTLVTHGCKQFPQQCNNGGFTICTGYANQY